MGAGEVRERMEGAAAEGVGNRPDSAPAALPEDASTARNLSG